MHKLNVHRSASELETTFADLALYNVLLCTSRFLTSLLPPPHAPPCSTCHTGAVEAMVGGNRKLGASPHRRGSPAHCDGSGFSPVHGGHGTGEVLSALAHAPGSPTPGGGRPAKVKRISDGSVDAAAAIAAAGGLSGLLGPLGPVPGLQLPLGGPHMGQMGPAAIQAAMQQQYMQQCMQQQYMQGAYGYPWMSGMMRHAAAPTMAAAAATPAPSTTSPLPTAPSAQHAATPAPTPAAAPAAAPAAPVAAVKRASTGAASAATAAPPHAAAPVVDPLPRRSAERWNVQQVADWMRTIRCEVRTQQRPGVSDS